MKDGLYISDDCICTYCALHYATSQKDKRKCLCCVNYDEFTGIECNMRTEEGDDDEL
jgi:hypothetical protein